MPLFSADINLSCGCMMNLTNTSVGKVLNKDSKIMDWIDDLISWYVMLCLSVFADYSTFYLKYMFLLYWKLTIVTLVRACNMLVLRKTGSSSFFIKNPLYSYLNWDRYFVKISSPSSSYDTLANNTCSITYVRTICEKEISLRVWATINRIQRKKGLANLSFYTEPGF